MRAALSGWCGRGSPCSQARQSSAALRRFDSPSIRWRAYLGGRPDPPGWGVPPRPSPDPSLGVPFRRACRAAVLPQSRSGGRARISAGSDAKDRAHLAARFRDLPLCLRPFSRFRRRCPPSSSPACRVRRPPAASGPGFRPVALPAASRPSLLEKPVALCSWSRPDPGALQGPARLRPCHEGAAFMRFPSLSPAPPVRIAPYGLAFASSPPARGLRPGSRVPRETRANPRERGCWRRLRGLCKAPSRRPRARASSRHRGRRGCGHRPTGRDGQAAERERKAPCASASPGARSSRTPRS